jgi:transposase-like protein
MDKRRTYTAEFKKDALALLADSGEVSVEGCVAGRWAKACFGAAG